MNLNLNLHDITPCMTLDVMDLSCPMPLIQAKRAMEYIQSGEVLEVLCTYPDSRVDVPAWCQRCGHIYIGELAEHGYTRLYIQKQ